MRTRGWLLYMAIVYLLVPATIAMVTLWIFTTAVGFVLGVQITVETDPWLEPVYGIYVILWVVGWCWFWWRRKREQEYRIATQRGYQMAVDMIRKGQETQKEQDD